MFRIVRATITEPLLDPDSSAGGVVTFDGRVRDLNEGQAVQALEYEALVDLAVKEGERIIEEALQRFPISASACVHRVGLLQLGEIAIRVEVAAAHRRAAFDACEFIVDEVKRRVPIWKKEHYTSGATDWINAHGNQMVTDDAFYSRQIRLPEVGEEGQNRLKHARVLVIGAGGLGCPAMLYLAGAGVGHLGVADGDQVDPSNLHRQPLYQASDIGSPKTHLAAERARSLNPFIDVREHHSRITARNAESTLSEYDLILDCTDNFKAKFLLNDTCVRLGKQLISASVDRFDGQLLAISSEGPCMRCLWPEAPEDGCVGSCEDDGVLGYVPGVLGALQAGEAIKCILGLGLYGVLTLVDLRDVTTSQVKLRKNPDCPTCGEGTPAIRDGLFVSDLHSTDLIIDIREPYETIVQPLNRVKQMPMSNFDVTDKALKEANRVILVCAKGLRSAHLAVHLRQMGLTNVFSYDGGASDISIP
ncbi:MAG: ThiF family adenylyltransferase [Fimbriimonas sp.]